MAFIQCDFFSDILGLSVSANVLLPQATQRQIGMQGSAVSGKVPWLYLLHGLSDDHSIWMRRTSIERYVADKGIAVVMPMSHRSRYCNLSNGHRYWDHISEEVPAIMRSFFPLSDRREDQMVAGISMGGFGAYKLALNYPDRYVAAASMSGALFTSWADTGERINDRDYFFGSEQGYIDGPSNLMRLAREVAAGPGPRPRLYQCCGTEDFLYHFNVKFRDGIKDLGYDHTYREQPGGHDWGLWDQDIQRVLEWLTV